MPLTGKKTNGTRLMTVHAKKPLQTGLYLTQPITYFIEEEVKLILVKLTMRRSGKLQPLRILKNSNNDEYK